MDPNEMLKAIRELIDEFDQAKGPSDAADTAYELVGRLKGFDGWLSNGGFYPSDWCNGLEQMFRHD